MTSTATALMLAALFSGAFGSVGAPAENDMERTRERAVSMDVVRHEGMVAVSIVGHSETPRVVRFTLEVDGYSTTRNAARSTVGTEAKTLSVVRFPDLAPWRVTLDVDEAEAPHYRLTATDKNSA